MQIHIGIRKHINNSQYFEIKQFASFEEEIYPYP